MSNEQEINKTSPLYKEFQSLLDKDFKDRKLHPNQVIKAKIIDILKAHCVVDVRGKSEGLIPLSEFKADEVAKLKVGDSIPVYLERLEGREGEIVLSYSKAKSFAAWQKCVDAFEKEEELTGKIVNKIKGGYIVALFDQAIFSFLPQSHLDVRPIRGAAVDRLMNTPIRVRLVRLDRNRGNCSCSRKEVLLKNQSAELKETLKNIKEGDIIENAIVKSIPAQSWGAFLDIGNNVTALLHQSDISWSRISSVTDILSVGQKIPKVVISKIDEKTNRVSVSIKNLSEDPYKNIEKRLKVGEIYEGKITKLAEFGAFVSLDSNIMGLCHVSEIDWVNRNIKPSKVFSVNQKANFKLLDIQKDTKKISLSYKQTLPNPWDKIKDEIGKVVKIKVTNVNERAVFGELPNTGLTGILHFKEISYNQKVEDLNQFKKGDNIDVKILEVKDDKIRLSKRALEKDPMDWFKENKKKVGSVISTKVVEVLKTGVKVAVDPDKKIIVLIKKNQLAIEAADCRPEIYNIGNTMSDAIIEDLDLVNRRVVLSPKAAQIKEQDSLIKKFGENAAKSGATLKSIFDKAIGKKNKKEK